MEVVAVDPADFPESLKPVASCFFNGGSENWRAEAKSKDSGAFALLLKVTDIPRRINGHWIYRQSGTTHMVWIKPSCFADMPADIATYAELNPDFPQQSTSNQFFDEAQWESYRRLGFEMGRRLFPNRNAFADFLPTIYRKGNVKPAPAKPRTDRAKPEPKKVKESGVGDT